MSDDKPRPADDETQPVRPEGSAGLPPAPGPDAPTADPVAVDPAPAPAARRGFGERLRSLRSSDGNRTYGLAALIASALAGIIIGGLGLTAVHAITHGDGPGDRFDRGWVQRRDDRGGPGFDGRGGMHGGPGGVPGQVPPTTPPEDDSDG